MKRPWRRKTKLLFFSLLSVALTLAGSLFYFNLRLESMLVEQPPRDVPPVTSPEFRLLLEAYLGKPFVEGNTVEHLRDGDEIFPAKLEAIAGAASSIHLEMYEFWGDLVAGAITDALIERAEAGVSVRVLLDFFGSRSADPEKFERMEAAGITLIRWRKPSWYHSGRFNNRTHRKLLIVDGRTGFTGGANLGDDWWESDAGGRPLYRDNHFRFTGPIVNQLQAAFLDNWLRAHRQLLLGDAVLPVLETDGTAAMQVLLSSPSDGKKRVRTFLLLAFAAAQESIAIQTAYFYPDPVIKQALIEAIERGVEVTILAPGEKINENIVRLASRNRWGVLLEAGVRIFEFQPSMFHSKLFLIDRDLVSLGSVNFDNRSFRLNDEANVNILCPDFGAEMRAVFDRDLEEAVEITLADWEARPFLERAIGFFGNLIGPQL